MTQTKPTRILMAGGGTGGHVMPIITIITMLEGGDYPAHQIYRYGKKPSLEHTLTQKINQTRSTPITFRSISSGKLRRDRSITSLFRNIRDMTQVMRGTLQAVRYMLRDRIQIVRCKGGYVAGPVIIAARILGIPLIVHESDTRMGLINRLASRSAKRIFTAFAGVHDEGQVIGQLLADEFAREGDRADFELLIGQTTNPKHTHVLVMGGSQGSQSLYQSLAQTMRMRPDIYGSYTFVVIGGLLSQDLRSMFAAYENVIVLDFLAPDELRLCYQYCDIALTRAGTTSLAEQKLRDMLLVMVPIPRTHDQHTNAQRYADHHGDILIQQDDALPSHLDRVFGALHAYKKSSTQTSDQRLETIRTPKRVLIDVLFMFAKD